MNLLTSLLISGNRGSERASAFLPPPQQLALISTLVVTPNLTTRAHSNEQLEASNLALRYLWSLLKLLGPENIPFVEAFEFAGLGNSSRRAGRGRRKTADDIFDSHKAGSHGVNIDLATTNALWEQVEDFWQVVGWAFNCSTMHKMRWNRWSLWLDFMITIFEDEMNHWSTSENGVSPTNEAKKPPEESLFIHYLTTETIQNGRERKILNSIFADGVSGRFTSAFPEVWKDETKLRKKAQPAKNAVPIAEKIDIEADEYRDYMADSGSDLEDAAVAPSAPTFAADPEITSVLGGSQAFDLRLRLIGLLSKVCGSFSNLVMSPCNFYGQLVEHIRPLPLPAFSAFLSSFFLNNLHKDAASTLLQSLLRSFIEAAAPTPKGDSVSQADIERLYLPFSANTSSVTDNAKMSICIEGLFRLLQRNNLLSWSEDFERIVEQGITIREKKSSRGKSKTEGERVWLAASAGRMRACIAIMKSVQP